MSQVNSYLNAPRGDALPVARYGVRREPLILDPKSQWPAPSMGDIDGLGAQLPVVQKRQVVSEGNGLTLAQEQLLPVIETIAGLSLLMMVGQLMAGGQGMGIPGAGSGPYGAAPGQESEKFGKPSANDKRPPGDNRTAEQIIEDNPVLKNLGNQKDINREGLKRQCGDWENDPDPQKRADAAYRVSKVLNYIDSSKNREGGVREGKVTNGMGDGNIEGITKDGDARHGTEAGLVKDFSEKGYSALPDNHQLDQTDDSHVRLNGSNMDNFQWGCQQAAKYIGFIPIVGGFLKGVGESEDGIWNGLVGGFSGAASDVTKGRFSPWGFAASAAEGLVEQVTGAGRHREKDPTRTN